MVNLFSSRTALTVDQNNNEVVTTRRGVSIKKTLVAVLCLGLVGSVAAIGVATSSHTNKNHVEQEWAPFLAKPSQEQIEKLALIRQLAPHSSTVMADDVCYSIPCLDTAIQFLISMNFEQDPCQDFHQFACGRWIANNSVPDSASRWSQFNFLRDEVNNITQAILTSPQNASDFKPLAQVKDFYALCQNLDDIEAKGIGAVVTASNGTGGWPSIYGDNGYTLDLVKAVGSLRRVYLDSAIVRVYVSEDLKNTTRRVVYLDQPSFFVSRNILTEPTNENNAKIIQAYKDYYVTVAKYFVEQLEPTTPPTEEQIRADVDAVIAFETKLAEASSRDVDRTDVERIYNPMKLNAFETGTPNPKINFKTLLDEIFSTSGVTVTVDEDVVVLEQEYFKALVDILGATDTKVIANYIQWRMISGLVPETTKPMRDAAFEFTKARTGQAQPSTRQSVCAGAALSGFGMAIGTKYIEQTFETSAKANVDQMVVNLFNAFRQLLEAADWMDDVTKANANAKSEAMRSFMAFPEWISNKTAVEKEYEGLEIDSTDYLASVVELSHWMGNSALKTLRVPTEKDYWLTYPGVVNAFYSPEFNSITFPAGILQPPFYRSKTLEAVNYGGIGVVIGHEITHGFDDQGSQYDKDGNAQDWWTPEDKENFNARAQCIIDQYSGFETRVGVNVDGELTQGENIADNGGLRESYQAYMNYIRVNNGGNPEKRLPGLEQYSAEQLFFLSYANIWCESITDEGLRAQLATDPHSPAEFRVLGALRNSVTFAEKWNCAAGTPMNPPVADKCVVW